MGMGMGEGAPDALHERAVGARVLADRAVLVANEEVRVVVRDLQAECGALGSCAQNRLAGHVRMRIRRNNGLRQRGGAGRGGAGGRQKRRVPLMVRTSVCEGMCILTTAQCAIQ